MDNRISCQEAAKILGTSTTTIRTLAREGVISYIDVQTDRRTNRYYLREELLTKRNSFKEYISLAENTDKKIARLRELNQKTEKEIEELGTIQQERDHWKTERNVLTEMVSQIYGLVHDECRNLPATDKTIMQDFLSGIPIEEIARKRKVKTQTIRRSLEHTINRIRYIRDVCVQLEEQKKAISDLTAENLRLQKSVDFYEERTEESERLKPSRTDEATRRNLLLQTSETGMTVRAFNAISGCDIRTLADLCMFEEKDIKNIHGMGKKTLEELRDILDRYGLHYGMDITQYGIAPDTALLKLFGKYVAKP